MDSGVMYLATVFFAIAVLHTFFASPISKLGSRFRPGSIPENLFHYLGEVEIVFGFWAFVLVGVVSFTKGSDVAVSYMQTVSFTEPVFVFVIMCMAATKPVMDFARLMIRGVLVALRFVLRIREGVAFYVACLVFGSLLGSLITEPAAMTVTALLLKEAFFNTRAPAMFKYATLGLLFVNISVGGVLTSFAAPPVVMVASKWGLTNMSMLTTYGWRAILAILVSTAIVSFFMRKTIVEAYAESKERETLEAKPSPLWLMVVHLLFLFPVILYHSVIAFFLPLFFLFLGWTMVSKEYQEPLRVRESLLVGFFLGGLVTLGGLQGWWLQPLLSSLGEGALFFGTAGLTAVTDNAALTYLGSLVEGLSPVSKYALLAGAITGGGLTVIANAPNPAGYGILNDTFGEAGISAGGLFLGALLPTFVTIAAFWFIP